MSQTMPQLGQSELPSRTAELSQNCSRQGGARNEQLQESLSLSQSQNTLVKGDCRQPARGIASALNSVRLQKAVSGSKADCSSRKNSLGIFKKGQERAIITEDSHMSQSYDLSMSQSNCGSKLAAIVGGSGQQRTLNAPHEEYQLRHPDHENLLPPESIGLQLNQRINLNTLQ